MTFPAGQSGCGKTAIASKVEERWKDKYQYGGYYGLIVSEDKQTMKAGFEHLCPEKDLPNFELSPKEMIKHLVSRLKKKYADEQILLVLDDLDKPHNDVMAALKGLIYTDKLRIIITTQQQSPFCETFKCLKVTGFSHDQAKEYLKPLKINPELQDEILRSTSCYPIALRVFKGGFMQNKVLIPQNVWPYPAERVSKCVGLYYHSF